MLQITLQWGDCWRLRGIICIGHYVLPIANMKIIHTTLKRVMMLNGHIYNRTGLANMMRRFTGKRELTRPAVTRFATAFLTLWSIHVQKANLRKMFTFEKWINSKWSMEEGGKRAASIVFMPIFWSTIFYALKLTAPLVWVLRLVDGKKKPPMGYIYDAMDRAKKCIIKSFNEREEKYKDVYNIIDRRWYVQLHRPLHAAGHYLNPEFFYSNPQIGKNEEIMQSLLKCIERLAPNLEYVNKIHAQLQKYRKASGVFGMTTAVRHRKTKAPVEWWHSFGSSTPQLQTFLASHVVPPVVKKLEYLPTSP